MQKIGKSFFVLLIACILSVPVTGMAAMPPILTAQQLQPGMIGTAETVVQGNEVESFNVKIIGVTDNGKGAARQIMAEAYGPVINDTNGVIHGMSGSPVYVNGYLIGAIARGIGSDTNPRVFYITPIEDMLKLWNLPDPKADEGSIKQVKINPLDRKEMLAQDEAKLEAIFKKKKDISDKMIIGTKPKINQEESSKMQFVDTTDWKKTYGYESTPNDVSVGIPLAVNGFYGAGMSFLKKELLPFNMYPYAASLGSGVSSNDDSPVGPADVIPGSSVGVALSYGDFSVGAVGTITAVDENRILAFGHPFTYKGNVNYFMTDASIVGTASGLVNGQKVSSFGKIIGRINQDRYSGVSGILGRYPSVVPMKVTVTDKQTGKQSVFATSIAYDEELLPNLAASVAYASLDRTIDSLSSGTANVKFAIRTNAVDNGEIDRSNMYYNSTDVGQFAVSELGQLLNIICTDTNRQYDVTGISIDMIFNEKRKTASIISVIPDKSVVHPGEVVNLKVILEPYRSPQEQILIPYTVPQNQASGNMTLEVRGGGLVPVVISPLQGLDLTPEENKSLSAADKIKGFLQTDKNNEIIVAAAVPAMISEKDQEKAIASALEMQKKLEADGQMGKKSFEPKENKAVTSYIIDNVVRINLNVKK